MNTQTRLFCDSDSLPGYQYHATSEDLGQQCGGEVSQVTQEKASVDTNQLNERSRERLALDEENLKSLKGNGLGFSDLWLVLL